MTETDWTDSILDDSWMELPTFISGAGGDALEALQGVNPVKLAVHDQIFIPLGSQFSAVTTSSQPSSQPRTGFTPDDARIPRSYNEDRAMQDESMAASSKAAIDKKCDKRPRSQNWSSDEKRSYLELKEEAVWAVQGKDWDFISQGLRERYGFDRSAKCCEDLWGTLRKAHFAILEHEHSSTGDLQTSNRVSFWHMGEDERSRKKLPLVFPLEWCKAMERILAAQEISTKRSKKKSRGIPPQQPLEASQYSSGRVQESFAEPKEDDEYSHQQPQLPNLEKEHVDDPVEAAVVEAIHSVLERLGNKKKRGATSEEDDLISRLRPLIKQKMEYAINDEAVMSILAPIFKPHIEEALERKLRPIASALQAIAQNQRRLQAIKDQRRALDLEEKKINRQRVGRHHRSQKKSSAEGVIP